jgi:hypothetical protein
VAQQILNSSGVLAQREEAGGVGVAEVVHSGGEAGFGQDSVEALKDVGLAQGAALPARRKRRTERNSVWEPIAYLAVPPQAVKSVASELDERG